jgi:hypothetical protein
MVFTAIVGLLLVVLGCPEGTVSAVADVVGTGVLVAAAGELDVFAGFVVGRVVSAEDVVMPAG